MVAWNNNLLGNCLVKRLLLSIIWEDLWYIEWLNTPTTKQWKTHFYREKWWSFNDVYTNVYLSLTSDSHAAFKIKGKASLWMGTLDLQFLLYILFQKHCYFKINVEYIHVFFSHGKGEDRINYRDNKFVKRKVQ